MKEYLLNKKLNVCCTPCRVSSRFTEHQVGLMINLGLEINLIDGLVDHSTGTWEYRIDPKPGNPHVEAGTDTDWTGSLISMADTGPPEMSGPYLDMLQRYNPDDQVPCDEGAEYEACQVIRRNCTKLHATDMTQFTRL